MSSTDRLHRLRAFLAGGAGAPFVWGERDCALWACDWIRTERGIDPAESLRGTYGSRLTCARLLRAEGGLPALAGRLAALSGLIQTDDPQDGDVGVIETRIGSFLGLAVGGRWAIKATDGIAISPAAATKAWAV